MSPLKQRLQLSRSLGKLKPYKKNDLHTLGLQDPGLAHQDSQMSPRILARTTDSRPRAGFGASGIRPLIRGFAHRHDFLQRSRTSAQSGRLNKTGKRPGRADYLEI